jgi:hypothetical protein
MKTEFKLALLALTFCSLFACQKKETPLLTVKDGLIGSWKMQLQGSDLNKNNKFDTDEKNHVLDTAKITYQLTKIGTGFRIGANNSFVDTMDWVLFNYESTLHFKIYDKGFINNQYFKFENNSNTLLLIDTTVSPVYFRSFERQN